MSKFICSLPWNHLSVTPHGWVTPCCEVNWNASDSIARNYIEVSGKEETLNIQDGVNKVINSDSYKKIRREMLNGDVPEACLSCYKMEKTGGVSKRMRERPPANNLRDITQQDGTISPDFFNIELRLGNYCNLKCRSCNAESSTSWLDDYNKLKDKLVNQSNYDGLLQKEAIDFKWVDNMDVYEDILKYGNNLDTIHVSGGEPFLVDKHSFLLDLLIEKGISKNINIAYITNGNYNFDKIVPILEKLKQFKGVVINFSLDDIFERNDYIRKLSNFKLIINNIHKFVNNYNFQYNITQTIHLFNFLTLEKLHLYLEKVGLYKKDHSGLINSINDNFVVYPAHHSPDVLPLEIRRQKIDSLEGIVEEQFLERIKKTYYNSECNNLKDVFLKTVFDVDRVRKEDYKAVFPDLKEVIENE